MGTVVESSILDCCPAMGSGYGLTRILPFRDGRTIGDALLTTAPFTAVLIVEFDTLDSGTSVMRVARGLFGSHTISASIHDCHVFAFGGGGAAAFGGVCCCCCCCLRLPPPGEAGGVGVVVGGT